MDCSFSKPLSSEVSNLASMLFSYSNCLFKFCYNSVVSRFDGSSHALRTVDLLSHRINETINNCSYLINLSESSLSSSDVSQLRKECFSVISRDTSLIVEDLTDFSERYVDDPSDFFIRDFVRCFTDIYSGIQLFVSQYIDNLPNHETNF